MPPRKPKPDTAAPPDELEPEEEVEEFAPGLTIRRKRGGGRPPKYRPEYAKIAGLMLKRGATINELAEAFGVTNSAVHYWKTKHPEFFEQFSVVSEALIARAEQSLADRAVGYTYDSVKVFSYKGIPVIIPIKEHVPPDVGALKHYLAVKKPDMWRIKEEIEMSGDAAFAEIFKNLGKKPPEQQS
jgi:hypothetical protein